MKKGGKSYERREFMKFLAAGTAAIGGLSLLSACNPEKIEAFFQKNFKELNPDQLADALVRLEQKYTKQYGVNVSVNATPAIEDTLFGYALDLSKCVGCRRCVYTCVKENNQSRNPQVHWIKVLELEKEKGVDLLHTNPYYNPEEVPETGHFYMPVQCQQCKNSPCTKVCPVGATWTEPDGIVVVDYNWCIGCRNCMAACPYGARKFNWSKPSIPSEELNPNTEYLGNRPRPTSVVEKCTFCIQRVRIGKYPACVEICPTGSRKFGNLLDEESEIRRIMNYKRVFILKEELNTQPKFFYFYGT
ncbi:4Fe-4S dicluster domain-containing protein [Bacteroidota bacterium]